jgi:hypothetical protein
MPAGGREGCVEQRHGVGLRGGWSRGCTAALCVAAATLLMAVGAPAGASAARWEVAGHVLASSSETELLESEGVLTIGVKGLMTTLKCEGGMNDLAIGGKPGTDEVQELSINCTDSSACAVEKVQAQKLGYKSELKELVGPPTEYYDLIKEIEVTFTVSGALCPAAGKYILEGNIEGVIENSSHKLVFPATELAGTSLTLNSLTAMKSYRATIEGEFELATLHHGWEWKVIT